MSMLEELYAVGIRILSLKEIRVVSKKFKFVLFVCLFVKAGISTDKKRSNTKGKKKKREEESN